MSELWPILRAGAFLFAVLFPPLAVVSIITRKCHSEGKHIG